MSDPSPPETNDAETNDAETNDALLVKSRDVLPALVARPGLPA